jgi:endo-1,4-beta-xylanase
MQPTAFVDDQIKTQRTADATVTILRPDGKPLANQKVVVSQRNHKFLFGTTGSSVIALANDEVSGAAKEKAQQHNQHLLELFNFVTLPFYWGRFEPTRGKPDTQRIKNVAKWFVDRGVVVKGHRLVWHTVCADWLMPLSIDEIIETQRQRIVREVCDFAGLTDSNGRIRFSGFLGEYTLSAAGKTIGFHLDKKETAAIEAKL